MTDDALFARYRRYGTGQLERLAAAQQETLEGLRRPGYGLDARALEITRRRVVVLAILEERAKARRDKEHTLARLAGFNPQPQLPLKEQRP